jgi:hypothetical protein
LKDLRERDWENLLWNVRNRRTVLFVGPDLGGGGETATAALTRRLAGLLREEGREVEGLSLPAVAQQFEDDKLFGRSDLEREVANFYRLHAVAGTEAEVYARLAPLPVSLWITTRHDTGLEQALRTAEKRVAVGRYHFRGANPSLALPTSAAAPLLYRLHGWSGEPPSLVLTERDLLEFLENVVAQRPGVPESIGGLLQQRHTTFLFLGFGLRHAYLRMLLRALKIDRVERSLAVEEGTPPPGPDDTVLFYSRGGIKLHDTQVAAFVAELARRFHESGAATAEAEDGLVAARARVFISYASEDALHARRLHEGLELAGLDAWLDRARLEGGDRWDPTIAQEIDRSDYILVLQSLTLAAKVDAYVNKEIALALGRAQRVRAPFKCLIPLQIEPCERLRDLEPYQTEPLRPDHFEEDVKKLVSLIRRDYQRRQREHVA